MDEGTKAFLNIVNGICLFIGILVSIGAENFQAIIGWGLAFMWFLIHMGHVYGSKS